MSWPHSRYKTFIIRSNNVRNRTRKERRRLRMQMPHAFEPRYNVMRHEYHTRNVPRALNRYRRQCARPLTKELCVNLIGHGMSLNSSRCAGRLEN